MALTTMSISSDPQPFIGFVETTGDALRLIQAARLGLVPRVNRRLNDAERRSMVRSGAVFIFSVEESGIRRWTEGLLWSASRIVGNFLVYREVTERGSGRASYGKSYALGAASSRRLSHLSPDQQSRIKFEKSLVGSLLDHHGRFKEEGLIKKTITVRISGRDHHLVSYYKKEDIESGLLTRPVARPDLQDIEIPSEMLESTTFRYPPKVETGQDGRLRYIRDADEPDELQQTSPPRRRFSSDTPMSPTRRSHRTIDETRPNLRVSPPTSESLPLPWLPSPESYYHPPVHQEHRQSFQADHSFPVRDYPRTADLSDRLGRPFADEPEVPHASTSTQTFPVIQPTSVHGHSSSAYNQHHPSPATDNTSGWPVSTWPYSHSAQMHGRWNSDPQLYAMNSMGNYEATVDPIPISSSLHRSRYTPSTSPVSSMPQETHVYASSSSSTAPPVSGQEPYGRVIESSYQTYYPHSSGA